MRRTYILSLCLICLSLSASFAQIKKYLADKEYSNMNYQYAIERYEKLIKKREADYELVKKLADSYRLIGNSEKAEHWYARAITLSNADPYDILYYADALRANGNYLEARNQFLQFGMKVPEEKKLAESYARACEIALEWMVNPVQIKVTNRKDLNSFYSEFSPVFFKNRLYFATDRKLAEEEYTRKELYGWTGTPYLYVMSALPDTSGRFKTEGKVDAIDNRYHNGPVSISKNGDTLFFTRSNKVKNPKKKIDNYNAGEFINRLEIYYAVRNNNRWTNITSFPYNDIANYSIGHPALSNDGRILYYASDMPGTIGGTDIFYSMKMEDGTWSAPVNAGSKVNSKGKELFPYVSADGSFYYASNGKEGMGGLDLFVAKGSRSEWKSVENMKYPFNSPKDDFGIVYDSTGKSGFFSSNREEGMGGDDIYEFRNPSCVIAGLTLHLVDGMDKPLEDVSISLYKKGDTSSVVAYERSTATNAKKVCLRAYQPCAMVYNAEGTFYLNLQPGIYELKASKNGYFTQFATIEANCKEEDTIKIALQLSPIVLNKPILLKDLFYDENEKLFVKRNIYYDVDKSDIRYDAALELDRLVEILKNNPSIKIELGSHTDSRHTYEYNQALSQRRAESAVKYIISKGIEKDRIVAKGYGEEKLVNKCKDGEVCSEEEHQQNRRTEIKVTEIIQPETYKVGPYDTMHSISRRFNISVEDLKELNNLQDEVIYVGDVLRLKRSE